MLIFRQCCTCWRALIGVMLLALLIQPALAAAAELHELEHQVLTGHSHADHDHQLGTEPPDESELDGWHLLLHFGHGCCQAVGLLPTTLAFPVADRHSAPALTETQYPSGMGLRRALRPPIGT